MLEITPKVMRVAILIACVTIVAFSFCMGSMFHSVELGLKLCLFLGGGYALAPIVIRWLYKHL